MADWTDGEVAIARRLAAEGLSARQIGDELGRTKNSVIGLCGRKGITLQRKLGGPRKRVPTKGSTSAPKEPPMHVRQCQGGNMPQRPEDRPIPPKMQPVQPEVSKARGVDATVAVGPRECRWPFGDPRTPEYRVCGQLTAEAGLSYCPEHEAKKVNLAWVRQRGQNYKNPNKIKHLAAQKAAAS